MLYVKLLFPAHERFLIGIEFHMAHYHIPYCIYKQTTCPPVQISIIFKEDLPCVSRRERSIAYEQMLIWNTNLKKSAVLREIFGLFRTILSQKTLQNYYFFRGIGMKKKADSPYVRNYLHSVRRKLYVC